MLTGRTKLVRPAYEGGGAMFLWIGCKLPAEFEKEIRTFCLEKNEQIGLDTVAFSLPQHISLKISFDTDRAEGILEDLRQFAATQAPFFVQLLAAEQAGNILWLPVKENEHLRQLHNALDARLESRFGIPQHRFDKCFLFHSTLFMDGNLEKLTKMQSALSGYPLPDTLRIDTFLLGISETGKPGTYRVVREIKV